MCVVHGLTSVAAGLGTAAQYLDTAVFVEAAGDAFCAASQILGIKSARLLKRKVWRESVGWLETSRLSLSFSLSLSLSLSLSESVFGVVVERYEVESQALSRVSCVLSDDRDGCLFNSHCVKTDPCVFF